MERAPSPATLRLATTWLWVGSLLAAVGLGLAHLAAGLWREYGGANQAPQLLGLAAANVLPIAGAVGLLGGREWGWRLLGLCSGCGSVLWGVVTVGCVVGIMLGAQLFLTAALAAVCGAVTGLCIGTVRQLRVDRPGRSTPPLPGPQLSPTPW